MQNYTASLIPVFGIQLLNIERERIDQDFRINVLLTSAQKSPESPIVSVKPTSADRAKNGAESIILRAKLVFTDSTEHSMAAAAVHPVPDSLPVLFAEYGADTYTDQVRFPLQFQSC